MATAKVAFSNDVTALRVKEPVIIRYSFLVISTMIGEVVRVEGGDVRVARVML